MKESGLIVTHRCSQARVFGPPIDAVGTQWEVQTDLSEQLHTFLRDNNWLVRRRAPSAARCHAILRKAERDAFMCVIQRLLQTSACHCRSLKGTLAVMRPCVSGAAAHLFGRK